MATFINLLECKVLTEIAVPLARSEFPCRWIYGTNEFCRWLAEELPKLQPGRLRATETPIEQMDNILYKWISGKRVFYDRMFKDLMPGIEEVWELKTVDLRVFGWMYQPRKFVAVFGDYADLYKGHSPSAKYSDARKKVISVRDKLSLDQPKYAKGTFDDLVCI